MSLLSYWKSSPEEASGKHIQQLIGIAGDGRLRDDSETARQFREFLANIGSEHLMRYARACLEPPKFTDSGLALQDIVNEIGRRLDYRVTNGRYRGTASDEIGFDGLWRAPENHHVVIEVKTSDFRISLETVARYRRELVERGAIEEEQSSILYVVGREDTGDLEAQIRGSRYAWDVRLISVEALLRLLSVREDLEDPSSASRIRSILVPHEYTRVDGIIDLVFSTKEDILQDDEEEEDKGKGSRSARAQFHKACVKHVERVLETNLIRRSRATFTSADETLALICLVSREYKGGRRTGYWFGFHPHQEDLLAEAQRGYIALGCGSEDAILLVPWDQFAPLLPKLNQTHKEDGSSWWHVRIHKHGDRYVLQTRADAKKVDLTDFLLGPETRA